MAALSELLISLSDPRLRLKSHLDSNIRFDGRTLLEARPALLDVKDTAVIPPLMKSHPYGYAEVSFGSSRVICRCELQIGSHSYDNHQAPAKGKGGAGGGGDIVFDVDLNAGISLKYENMRNKPDDAYLIEDTLYKVYQSHKIIDRSKLAIRYRSSINNNNNNVNTTSIMNGQDLGYQLQMSISVLSMDGCISCAAIMAVSQCLQGLHLPQYVIDKNMTEEKQSSANSNKTIPVLAVSQERYRVDGLLVNQPVPLQIALVGENNREALKIIVDPNAEEEALASSLVFAVFSASVPSSNVEAVMQEGLCGMWFNAGPYTAVNEGELLAEQQTEPGLAIATYVPLIEQMKKVARESILPMLK